MVCIALWDNVSHTVCSEWILNILANVVGPPDIKYIEKCAQHVVHTAQTANDIRGWQMRQSAPKKRGKDLSMAEEYNFILR